MQQRPELIQLQKLVIPKIANKWDSVGIQLDFDAVQISKIEDNHQELPVETSCQRMLWGWLASSSNNSNHAKDLIQAVKDVEYIRYAEELKTGFKFYHYRSLEKFMVRNIRAKKIRGKKFSSKQARRKFFNAEYRIALNFGGAKLWRIRRIAFLSPNITLQNSPNYAR